MHERRIQPKKKRIVIFGGLLVLICLVVAFVRFQSAPLTVVPSVLTPTIPSLPSSTITWPAYGQSAIASSTYGVVAQHGDTVPQATASTAKLITMFAVLKKKPFTDSAGPSITFTQADVDRYTVYVAGNGSVVPVSNGLTWTQYQAMEAVLLESANNVADSLAVWAFGSLDAYREYAQKMVEELGMNHTTIGSDASGYSPTTTSTASDLAVLARAVLKEPALRQIVHTKSADLPGAGTITNTNQYLGSGGVIGMKTGYTPEAGGVFVLAGTQEDNSQQQDVITVVMGAPGSTSTSAQLAAYALYISAKQNFHYQTIIKRGDALASYRPAWSQSSYDLVADESVGLFMWSGIQPNVQVYAPSLVSGSRAQGDVTLAYGAWSRKIPLTLTSDIPQASWWWRIFGH